MMIWVMAVKLLLYVKILPQFISTREGYALACKCFLSGSRSHPESNFLHQFRAVCPCGVLTLLHVNGRDTCIISVLHN